MVLDFLKRGETTAPVQTKASASGPLIAWSGTGRAVWSPRDLPSLARNGFMGNPVGFRAVKVIAEASAALPLVLRESGMRLDVHPVGNLIERPNPGQGKSDFLEALFAQVLLTGNGFVEAAGLDQQGPPMELHVLRSDRMAVVPGTDGWPVAYEYSVNGKKHRFNSGPDMSPICHIKTFHPQDDHYGFSPLQSAASAIDVHNAASRWSKALLDNAARPSGAIVYRSADGHGSMSEEQYNRLQEEMAAHHQGARNAGRPMLLEGGLDWKPMGFSPSDMEFQKTKDAAAREIALAFGVPPMLLGIPGDATYANYQEANRAFYRLTVLPLVSKVAGAISGWLTQFNGKPLSLEPDLDQVPALSAEREAQWRRVEEASFLTDAEKREMLGLAPLPAGDRT